MPPSKQNSDVRPAPGNGLRGANDDHTETSSLGESNHGNSGNGTFHGRMAMFSCDLDSFDFKARNAQQVIDVTMKKLDKLGKGIILMHDFHKHTAEALPALLRKLKEGGY